MATNFFFLFFFFFSQHAQLDLLRQPSIQQSPTPACNQIPWLPSLETVYYAAAAAAGVGLVRIGQGKIQGVVVNDQA